jgi:flavodoxin
MTTVLLSGCSSDSDERETRSRTISEDVTNENADSTSENQIIEAPQEEESTLEEADVIINEDTVETKILIAYFTRADNVKQDENLDAVSSASINLEDSDYIGNMEIMADYVANRTGGDKFSIHTLELYSQNYRSTTDQAKEEQNNDARPELVDNLENIDDYDIIFLGYPNWWGTIPMPMYTFLEAYDFTGKTIIPFCSHEGSGLGSGVADIKELCPDATILDGLAIRGSKVKESEGEILEWIETLEIFE